MMRNRSWIAVLAVALMACGGGDAEEGADETPESAVPVPDSTVTQPAPTTSSVQFPEGVTQQMADAGRTLFNTGVCFACHLVDAMGGPLAPPLNDATWLNTDGSYEGIVNTIKTGVPTPKEHPGVMPPMGGGQYTDEQVNQLAAYIFSISRGG